MPRKHRGPEVTDVYIAMAKRSPIGKLKGALSGLSAAEIGGQVIRTLVREAEIDAAEIDEVIIGQVLTGGAGQNPARQAAMAGGLPEAVPAVTTNMVCGAGQKSIHMAAQAIKAGDAELVLAGGQDSMSQAPHFFHARSPRTMGEQRVRDMMVTDGLWDAFNDVHMGDTVESLARRFQVTRDEQDAFAANSQRKASEAADRDRFLNEIVPICVEDTKGDALISDDEHPRPDATVAKLAAMLPAFDPEGTITAGNSSGINDGAAFVLVGSEERLYALGLKPMARIVSYASAALDPMDMGLGPAAASRKALKTAGWSVEDLDVMEVNEAYAAQAIAVNREMGWDPDRINPNGGAIALGHPLAGSGCRIVVTLLHEMQRRGKARGLASMCIGGGQGVAICLAR